MRNFIIILFIFLINKETSFGQKDISTRSSSKVSTSVVANVNRLNDAAYGVMLTSPDSAHKLAANALILAEKSNYIFGKGRSFYNIGLIYWSQSYYPISLFYLKSAIPCLPKSSPLYLSDAYRALGRTYADLKSYNLALKELDTAFTYAGNDVGRLAEVYSERSHVYSNINSYYRALATAKHALRLNKAVNARGNIAVLYCRLGDIYINIADYASATAYTDIASRMSIQLKNRRLHAYTYLQYALIDNKTAKYNDAINYAQKAIALADSIGVMDATKKSYNALINSFELKNDLKTALTYQNKFNLLMDSLGTTDKLKTITLVQNYYDLNTKINGIELMQINNSINKGKIRSQGILILILLSSLVVVIIVLTATYYFYREKQLLSNKLQQQHTSLLAQKQLIEDQSVDLKKVNGLKDKLLAVIGHDLRTPVANLSNIIEMFNDGYLTTKDVHDLMRDINPIIKGAELTLSNLVEWAGSQIKGRNVHASGVDIFLLGVEMEQTFIHALLVKKIEFNNHAYPGQGVFADENHLKVVIRNLISNAIKFTGHEGNITISTIIENNDLIISVTDTGKGMTKAEIDKLFYLNTHFSHSGTSGEKGTGIGLILCKELVELNGGRLSVKSTPGKGSTFYFNLPLVKAYA